MLSFSQFPIPLFFFLSILLTLQQHCLANCHVDDETGLLGFKSGIKSDPSGLLSSWKAGTDCCKWSGISCGDNNRVTSLSIGGQPDKNQILSGTISPSLSKLKMLTSISLTNLKNLVGTPNFLLSFPNIQIVYLENNKLSGQIPPKIGNLTQLFALSFLGNKLTGPIPSSIGQLTQLSQLKLGDNLLTGTIPNTFNKLKSLSYLSLEKNQLSGSIPNFFNSLSNLRILTLSHNKFTGNIPSSITALAPILRFLEVGHNYLSGKIPDFLGKFRALDTLDLSYNRFSGTVPKTFANLTKIFNLDLSHNLLVDPFPTLFVKGIESLDLSYNNFHLNTIPSWVTSSPIIYSLKLAKCGIKIKLDDWNPKTTYFYDYIDLSDNEITGSPIGLLNKTDLLIGFYAAGNKLKFDLEKMKIVKTLKELDLSRNMVYGKVPKEISGLNKLNLSSNHLSGQLPPTKFKNNSFAGNKGLCGSPLPPCKKA
ncbi:hypothetical protein H5410_052374 [Solanum commersonii]|uniref:Leucine-rich repeat-containing N-terminal plant-type domain-containing protein n=1 Tax=Solanum commersonii TaxID=4109 RepID=A0A9J5X0Y4_SOLCO|nr:hypothetical protein H5410_052374 [Solanum commersonii]